MRGNQRLLLRLWWGKVKRWTATWRSALDGRWASSLQTCCRRSEQVQQKHFYLWWCCSRQFLAWYILLCGTFGTTFFFSSLEFASLHKELLMYETTWFTGFGILLLTMFGFCVIYLLNYLFWQLFSFHLCYIWCEKSIFHFIPSQQMAAFTFLFLYIKS